MLLQALPPQGDGWDGGWICYSCSYPMLQDALLSVCLLLLLLLLLLSRFSHVQLRATS